MKNNYLANMERQLGLWGEASQEKIHHTTIAIGGVGGIGAISALMIAKAGFGHIRLVDRDAYGVENIVEQAFATYDTAGKDKAQTAKKEMMRHTRFADIAAWTADLSDMQQARKLVQGTDILISGVDNAPARIALGRAAEEANIPMIVSANVGWTILHTTYQPGANNYAASWKNIPDIQYTSDGFPDLSHPATLEKVKQEWAIWIAAMSQFEPDYLETFINTDQDYLWYSSPPAYFAASLGIMDALKIATGKGAVTSFPDIYYYDLKSARQLTWESFSQRRKALRDAWSQGSKAIQKVIKRWD
jgi:molybdopterin/thiamine biosynthesis adenylyltransferase